MEKHRGPSPLIDVKSDLPKQISSKNISIATTFIQEHENDVEEMFKVLKMVKWKNPEPMEYIAVMVELHGLPDVVSPQIGGSAIWSRSVRNESPFYSIQISDDVFVD